MSDGLRRWLPVLGWSALVLALGQEPFSAAATGSRLIPFLRSLGFSQEAAEITHGLVRKGGHVGEYAGLGALTERALAAAPRPASGGVRAARAVALALAVAAADEGLQAQRPERTGSRLDVALDLAGAGLGIAVARRLLGRRSTKEPPPGSRRVRPPGSG